MLLMGMVIIVHVTLGQVPVPPIMYEPYWELPELSPEQRDTVLAVARQHAQSNSTVWAVLVTDSGDRVRAQIYYTPQFSSNRLHRGAVASVRGSAHSATLDVPSWKTYCCVAPVGQSELVLAQGRLPFAVEGELSDDDIVQIADLSEREKGLNPGVPQEMLKQYQDAPILRITVRDKVVEVFTAISRRPLAGRGAVLTFEKKNGQWIVISRRHWLS